MSQFNNGRDSGRFSRWMVRQRYLSTHLPTLFHMLRPALHEQRRALWLVAALLPVSAAMATLIPYLTQRAVDDYILPAMASATPAPYLEDLSVLVMTGFAVVVAGYICDALYVQVLQRAGQTLIAELRTLVYARTLRLPRRYYDQHSIGSILTRVTTDIEALGESLAGNVLSMFVDFLKSMTFIIVMFYLSWRLTLVLLIGVPVLVLVIRFFQLRVRHAFFRARKALADATGYLQESLNGMKTVQLYNAEAKISAEFERRNRVFYVAQNESNFYDALLFSLVEGITTFALALVLWYAAGASLEGLVTLGVLIAFMEYIQRLFVPVRELSQQLAILQRAMAALDHIGSLFTATLDEAELKPVSGGDAPRRKSGFERLRFVDVSFAYEEAAPPVLKNLSFELRQGQTLALVGATGSGKSTVTRLLTRAYGGFGGEIELNGQALSDYGRADLSHMIAVVHQDVFLFHGSIAFNIGLGRADIDQAAIEAAARYVHADEFIRNLDGGFDFAVAHGGANLSAGQCQLISFARAVAANADLIVLDEATSAVDSVTEAMIERALANLYADKTVIAIAHRLSTIRNADKILVLDGGDVIESGNHEQLMALGGHYRGLIAGQGDDGAASQHGG
jgi:ATP-binding cassette, subfamily B, multidrug efflux pump